MNEISDNCKIQNEYLRKHIGPDVVATVELVAEGDQGSSDWIPELTGAVDIVASLSGLNPAEAIKDADKLKRGLGCVSCEFINVCPLPKALESAAQIAKGNGYLNSLVDASENGNMIAKAWLTGRMNAHEINEGGDKDAVVSLSRELAHQSIESRTTHDAFGIEVSLPLESDGSSKKAIVVDATGKVSKVLKSDGKVALATSDELFQLVECLRNVGVDETIAQRLTTANKDTKTKDTKPIFKSKHYTAGGYRLIMGIGNDPAGNYWFLLSDAVDHDAQDDALRDGPATSLHVADRITELCSK